MNKKVTHALDLARLALQSGDGWSEEIEQAFAEAAQEVTAMQEKLERCQRWLREKGS